MFTLRYMNVVKIVDSDIKRDQLLAKGYTLVDGPAAKEDSPGDKPYEDMTREELFAACEVAGINVPHNTKTETLIARLRRKDENREDEEGKGED
jgi:hypothetical protein